MPELVDDVLELLAPFPSANALAREIGFDSAQSASTAANLAVPLILAGMVHQLNDADRSAGLIEIVRTVDTESLGDFGLALTERRYEPVGSETIKQILGSKHQQIAATLAPQAECVEQSAAEVFSPMAWVVTGLIAKRNGSEQNRHSLLQIVRNEHDGLLRTGWGEWMSAVSPDIAEPENSPEEIPDDAEPDDSADDEQVEPDDSADVEQVDPGPGDVEQVDPGPGDVEQVDPGPGDVEPDECPEDIADDANPEDIPDSVESADSADDANPEDSADGVESEGSADGVESDSADSVEPADGADDVEPEESADGEGVEPPGSAQALAPAWWREKKLSATPGGATITPVGPTPDQPLEQAPPQVSAHLGHAIAEAEAEASAETGDENEKRHPGPERGLWPAAVIAAVLLGAAGVWFLLGGGRDAGSGSPVADAVSSDSSTESASPVRTTAAVDGSGGPQAEIVSFEVTLTDPSEPATAAAIASLQFDQNGQQLCYNVDMNGSGSSLDGVVERAVAGSATEVVAMGLLTDLIIGCIAVQESIIEAILADPAAHRLALFEPGGDVTVQGPLSRLDQ